MDQFIKEVKEILVFFDPISNQIQKLIVDFYKHKPGCSWNDEKFKYDIHVLSFGGQLKSLDGIIFRLLDDFIKENIDKWIQKFSNKDWFDYNKDFYYITKEICNFLTRIFINAYSGENLQIIISRELDILFEIKSPITKRIKQVIIQNLVLEKDQVFDFKDHILAIKGREERWQEGKIAKSCKINDFSLKFSFRLRRISPEEFESFSHSRGLLTDQMNISTCLEIIYEFPNDRFASRLSELTFKSHLATSEVADFIDKTINKLVIAIKFSTGSYVYPVVLKSIPQNYYLQKFFPEGISIRHRNWMYSFFTGKCIIDLKRFKTIQEIFDLLFDFEKFPIAEQVLTIMERADSALQYELFLTSMTMYWIITESILSGPKAFIANQISWLYGPSRRNVEREFWELVYDLRNDYMHGKIWNIIEDKIKNKYQNKNIKWFVLVTREKIMRVLLFLFLLRKSSETSEELFQTRIKFNQPPSLTYSERNKFKNWIQLGKENELGSPQKYKIGIGLKLISI